MSSRHKTVHCRYHYDALDRIASVSTNITSESQRFYCKTRIATQIDGLLSRSYFQHNDLLLTQQQNDGSSVWTTLLATDNQRSVLSTVNTKSPEPIAYSPYGHRPANKGLITLLAFNGELPDPVTGCYLLGNGYRAFNPVLMRFNSPDSWSPFKEGGLNAYVYCVGDPINRGDPKGRASFLGSYIKFAVESTIDKLVTYSSFLKAFKYANKANPSIRNEAFNGIIDIVASSPMTDKRQVFFLRDAQKLTNSSKLKHQLVPGEVQRKSKASHDFEFYNRPEFGFEKGVPTAGAQYQLPNGGETYLSTLHFDAAINVHIRGLRISSGIQREAAAMKLHRSVINRAAYIVRHSESLIHNRFRAARGMSMDS